MFDFTGLGRVVLDTELMDDFARRVAALAPYKAEITALMIGLHQAGIVGNTDRPADPAEVCDTCSVKLQDSGLYVDGALEGPGGVWGNMCMSCFGIRGKGLGWGIGQLYSHDGIGWQCIAGGNPRPREDEEE